MLRMLLCCVNIFILIISINADAPEINISQGTLRGKYQKTWKGKTFSSFTGIPYAKPPVGDLRFEAPVPAGSWEGTLDATRPHVICAQRDIFIRNGELSGDEDCLYLNVYTPKLANFASDTPLPVMFFIHGGGWISGNAGLYGPGILLDQDIILVTMNYRLGALGFLSTGDEVVPGNNGLKDQSLALKWVKHNIEHFGGNPDKITVFGQSAGGASAHYHMLSPLSKDLMSGVIAQSGTATAQWAMTTKQDSVKKAKKLAKLVDCPTDSSKDMVDCMKKLDAYDIIKQDTKFMKYMYAPMMPFKPVVELDIEGAFLPEDPVDIIKSGKAARVPFVTGITSEDGAMTSAYLYEEQKLITELNNNYEKLLPYLLLFHKKSEKQQIAKQIRKYYLGSKKIDESTKNEVTNIVTDGWFLLASDTAVRLHLKYTKYPVYYYLFGREGLSSFSTLFGDSAYDYGVCHGDELFYLFHESPAGSHYKPNEHDRKIIDIMTTLWTNFAKTGNPTPELNNLITTNWKPVDTEKLEYYNIKDDSNIYMDENLYAERAKFWRNLPIDFRKQTIRDEL